MCIFSISSLILFSIRDSFNCSEIVFELVVVSKSISGGVESIVLIILVSGVLIAVRETIKDRPLSLKKILDRR